MSSVDEKVITDSWVRSLSIGLSVASFFPLFYSGMAVFMQVLFGERVGSSNDDTVNVMTYVIILLSFLIIVIVYLKLTTMTKNAVSFAQALYKTAFTLATLMVISVLGLVHAMFSLTVFRADVNVPLVIGTSLASIMSMLIFTHKVGVPTMQKFVGMKY